jgi:flagellar protein FliL
MAQEPVVEEVTSEEGAPKKSKKKLIIIIAAVVVALLGGGGAAWFFMGHKSAEHKVSKKHKADSEESADKEDAAKEGESKDEEASAEEGKSEEGHGGEPLFVKLETFTLNLNPEEGEKYLQVDISLSPSNKDEGAFLEAHMPQVRNRILMVLTSKKPSEIATMEGKQALSKELVEQINQPYASGGKKLKLAGVYFTSFVIQ